MMRSGSQVRPLRATLHDGAMTAVPHRAVVSCDYSRSYKGGVLMSVHNCTFSAVVKKYRTAGRLGAIDRFAVVLCY
jgi:hypothetical protein